MEEKIVVKGAREHNLKNIDVSIPRNALTVIQDYREVGNHPLLLTLHAEVMKISKPLVPTHVNLLGVWIVQMSTRLMACRQWFHRAKNNE